MKAQSASSGGDDDTQRMSITIPSEEKAALERIAAEKRVSLAWVVRDAITQYLAAQKSD